MIFDQNNEINPTVLVEEEATYIETPKENGEALPILNQLTSQNSPPIDAPDALDSPPPGVQEDASDTCCLESVDNLPGESLTAIDGKIFGIYQDWFHQNTLTHLYGRIEEDGKWQER